MSAGGARLFFVSERNWRGNASRRVGRFPDFTGGGVLDRGRVDDALRGLSTVDGTGVAERTRRTLFSISTSTPSPRQRRMRRSGSTSGAISKPAGGEGSTKSSEAGRRV